MPRFEDYRSDPEVREIVEKYVKKFPRVFDGFSADDIGFIVSMKKKSKGKHPIKVRTVPYPHFVFSGKTYIFETLETKWEKMDQKKKNLAVFHAMCSIPIGGFDPGSKVYGRILKPDFELFRNEYAVAGGVADWFEDDRARDPMEVEDEKSVIPEDGDDEEDPIPAAKSPKSPVTAKDLNLEEEPEAVAS